MPAPGRDLHRVVDAGHGDGGGAIVEAAVAELAVVVGAPAARRPVDEHGTGVPRAGGDARRVEADRLGLGLIGELAVPELAAIARAPAGDRVGLAAHAAVRLAEGELGRVVDQGLHPRR